MSYVTESRPLDYMYDQTFTGPNNNHNHLNNNLDSLDSVNLSQSRYKFFTQPPIINNISYIPSPEDNYTISKTNGHGNKTTIDLNSFLSSDIAAITTASSLLFSSSNNPRVKDASVQTMYRESETQTDPYSPEYILPISFSSSSSSATTAEGVNSNNNNNNNSNNNNQPDILLLDQVFDFHQKGDIHITSKHIAHIIELKNKKILYANLPPFTDEMSMLLRKRLLERQELYEMNLHETEMDENRDILLQSMITTFNATQTQQDLISIERLENIKLMKLQLQESKLETTKRNVEKALRQIARKKAMDPYVNKTVTGGANSSSSNNNGSNNNSIKQDLVKDFTSTTNGATPSMNVAMTTNDDNMQMQALSSSSSSGKDTVPKKPVLPPSSTLRIVTTNSSSSSGSSSDKNGSSNKNVGDDDDDDDVYHTTFADPNNSNRYNAYIDNNSSVFRINHTITPSTINNNTIHNNNSNNNDDDDDDDDDDESTYNRLDILNSSIHKNNQILKETLHLSQPETMKKEILVLPKIFIPTRKEVTKNRLSASKVKENHHTKTELDYLYNLLQQSKLQSKSAHQLSSSSSSSSSPVRHNHEKHLKSAGGRGGGGGDVVLEGVITVNSLDDLSLHDASVMSDRGCRSSRNSSKYRSSSSSNISSYSGSNNSSSSSSSGSNNSSSYSNNNNNSSSSNSSSSSSTSNNISSYSSSNNSSSNNSSNNNNSSSSSDSSHNSSSRW